MELLVLLDLERTGDAAVFANSPKVNRQENDEDKGKHQNVQDVPAQQCFRANLLASQKNKPHLVSEHWRKAHHVGTHRYRPQGQLIPWKEVPGKRQQKGEFEEHDSDHPVEFARCFVSPVVKDPGHM